MSPEDHNRRSKAGATAWATRKTKGNVPKKHTLTGYGFLDAKGRLHGNGVGPMIFLKRKKSYEDGVIRLNKLIGTELVRVVGVTVTYSTPPNLT